MLNILRLARCPQRSTKSLILFNYQSLSSLLTNKKESIRASTIPSASTMATDTNNSNKDITTAASDDNNVIKFLEIVGNLKNIKRTGWVLRGVKDCESVAAHMYRMSIMTFLLEGNPDGLDRLKCLELALVHDMAESLVGDITPYCGISKEVKKEREVTAMHEISQLIEPRGKRMLELFVEYEENKTAEARFVKDLDRLDMVLQAYEYEKRDNCPLQHQEFFESTEGKFNHPLVVRLVEQIKALRLAEKARKDKHNNTTTTSSS